ncbi:MAG: hypothetical protein KA712_02945 [Myxococcales bacterium]|nr:hypothetical protein [Myxococcales bacterium]
MLLDASLISWIAALHPSSRFPSPHWRSLWREALARRIPGDWAYGRSKMDMTPVVIENVKRMSGLIRDTFSGQRVRSAEYFDVPALRADLESFTQSPDLRRAFWLSAALAVELWLRKLS